jgi:hypothetical protein
VDPKLAARFQLGTKENKFKLPYQTTLYFATQPSHFHLRLGFFLRWSFLSAFNLEVIIGANFSSQSRTLSWVKVIPRTKNISVKSLKLNL